jgi:hypothetical protein
MKLRLDLHDTYSRGGDIDRLVLSVASVDDDGVVIGEDVLS